MFLSKSNSYNTIRRVLLRDDIDATASTIDLVVSVHGQQNEEKRGSMTNNHACTVGDQPK